MKILFFGDLIGNPGRALLQKHLVNLRMKYSADLVIVNGENSAPDGRGITPDIMNFFKSLSVDVVTTGNHIWAKKEIYPYFQNNKDLLRPLNFPAGCPGSGLRLHRLAGGTRLCGGGQGAGRVNLRARLASE